MRGEHEEVYHAVRGEQTEERERDAVRAVRRSGGPGVVLVSYGEGSGSHGRCLGVGPKEPGLCDRSTKPA